MSKPAVGPASILGWLTFVLAEATTAVTAATASQAQLEGPGKWVAILGIISLVVTNGGRYLQARELVKPAPIYALPAGEVPASSEVPPDARAEPKAALAPIEEELAQPPPDPSPPPPPPPPLTAAEPPAPAAAPPVGA